MMYRIQDLTSHPAQRSHGRSCQAVCRLVALLLLATLAPTLLMAQQGAVRGRVYDRTLDEPMQFVNVAITRDGDDASLVKGNTTDENGRFHIDGLKDGKYVARISFLGYTSVELPFAITPQRRSVSLGTINVEEDRQVLQETVVTEQRAGIKLEVDRKLFEVDQQIANAGGSASEVLENIPSVEVDQEGNVSLRGNSSVEVWINGKASGLTSDNRAQILEQLPAESIERIEVIDNPSAKFSAEGSAGIINIILKKDRRAGYYGSLQAGGNTQGGANASGNINYSSPKWDGYFSLGYRHRQNNKGGSFSRQDNYLTGEYENNDSWSHNRGNNVFMRAGVSYHLTERDELSLSGMHMEGGHNNLSQSDYRYGPLTPADAPARRTMLRRTTSDGDSRMWHGELNYQHDFGERHTLAAVLSYDNWRMDDDIFYQDSTTLLPPDADPTTGYAYQHRPNHVRNNAWEAKLDYENQLTEKLRLQAGYQGRFSHENTPQDSWAAPDWDGLGAVRDEAFYNRFIYDIDVHALYATASYQLGRLGIMAGLRGEYWKVFTESYSWAQENDPALRDEPFAKDYFELFPSLFLSHQLTETQQLQLNYTRRLRRPWGGQLNSFRNTRDASIVEYGNPELTPEFSSSFSLNYLKTWEQHTLSLSAYYRPTTDVMQRIRFQNPDDGMMYMTTENVSKSVSTGLEVVAKDKVVKWLDLTTTLNAYYYEIDGFGFDMAIPGYADLLASAGGDASGAVASGTAAPGAELAATAPTVHVSGEADDNFTWNVRMLASVMLPYSWSLQATGNYRSRQVITQGHRGAGYGLDLGLRKTFLDRKFALAVNCRDVLDSRQWETETSGTDADGNPSFTRHQKNWRGGRMFNATLTWNFGNMKAKKPQRDDRDDDDAGGGFDMD